MTTETYISKDQNWNDETTTYWFDVDGETYGVVESSYPTTKTVVDVDGCPDNAPAEIAQSLLSIETDNLD